MNTTETLRAQIVDGAFDNVFAVLYPTKTPQSARERWIAALTEFERIYGTGREAILVSAPGRTEIGGNHTDHQHGRVLAASVNLDIVCVASKNDDYVIREKSQRHAENTIELSDLAPRVEETGCAKALIRGVAAWFSQNGHIIGGFNAYTTSEVLSGSGLSSSAAFEVAVRGMLNFLYNNGAVTVQQIAIAGKFAENNYFQKPCGIMDQMASSVGSLVEMDFADPENPIISPIPFDFTATGFKLCIVDTKGSHSDLTGEYAAITIEMGKIAGLFGKKYLRDVDENEFRAKIPELRKATGDRAVLRAMHFFADNARVPKQATALRDANFTEFLRLINESGQSSLMQLQNIFAVTAPHEQGVTLALAASERVLEGKGAWRVHGGGFAGTIQAFVPNELLEEYRHAVQSIFGEGSCHVMTIRPVGGVEIRPDTSW